MREYNASPYKQLGINPRARPGLPRKRKPRGPALIIPAGRHSHKCMKCGAEWLCTRKGMCDCGSSTISTTVGCVNHITRGGACKGYRRICPKMAKVCAKGRRSICNDCMKI